MQLAKRSNIAPSLTLAMNAKAKQMKAQGIDVISFAAGEPDFHTPHNVKEAGKKAIDENKTYYTPDSGIPELKKAVAAKLGRENGLDYSPEEIVINSGAKHSVFNALSVLVDEGDEVLIPSPYWVSYSEMVTILGGRPVFIPSTEKTGFKIHPSDLEKAMSGRVKVIILNSPNNPTGAVFSRDELFACAKVLEDMDIFVISDEVYEKIVYEGNVHVSIATFSEKLKKKTVVVNGMSKAFSMTGWRIGYCAGPKQVIEAIAKLQGHTCGNPVSISQYASLAALGQDTNFMTDWVKEFKKRRDVIVGELNGIDGVSCLKPEGAFYVFPNMSRLFGKTFHGTKVEDSMEMANYLLERGRIAVVPGRAFGADNHIRISFATSMANIAEGLKRLKESLRTS
jgi:aspartate aminotransferase